MSGEAVRVVVRCRPSNQREHDLNCDMIVDMEPSISQVQLRKPDSSEQQPKSFTFDGVYYVDSTTYQIYEEVGFPLVGGVLEGYNGTVFAYGQTGCGKSFTMMGPPSPEEQKGIIPRAFGHIFDHISVTEGTKFLVHASYLEIYNEEVRDLLGKDVKRKLDLKEHPEKGVYVNGLSQHKVSNVQDLEHVMDIGSKNRSVGATLMNVDSSRSHSMFTIDVEMASPPAAGSGSKKKEHIRAGRLNLVDLAGSERQSKTGSTGERLKEATKINLSLSALGNVISALVDGKSKHIPYRDSKLTRLLQSSLGGNTKTLMVACISPADNNYDETLSTLRYANRAKNIKNKPKINEDPRDALLRQYQEEITQLKRLLQGEGVEIPSSLTGTGGVAALNQVAGAPPLKSVDLEQEREKIRQEYEARISQLTMQYTAEQQNSVQLQEELKKTREDYEQQLADLNDVTMSQVSAAPYQQPLDGQVQPLDRPVQSLDKPVQPLSMDRPPLDGQSQVHERRPSEAASHTTIAANTSVSREASQTNEVEVLRRRLQELEEGLVGGEGAANTALKEELDHRKQKADDRREAMQNTNVTLDSDESDEIFLRIFSNVTEELSEKNKCLEREIQRRKTAEEDTKDLQHEFQEEREDLLDIIRKQNKQLKLQEQIIHSVVPCLRRDCNYYYIDKVISESKWDEDTDQWIMPKLTLIKNNLPSGLTPSNSSPTLTKGVVSPSRSPNSAASQTGNDSIRPSVYDSPTEEKSFGRLQGIEESTYFKPKRAAELLSNKDHGKHSTGIASNNFSAATVHKVDGQVISDPNFMRRPNKLESLNVTCTVRPMQDKTEQSIVEKVDKKISSKKRGLQPLGDIQKHPPTL